MLSKYSWGFVGPEQQSSFSQVILMKTLQQQMLEQNSLYLVTLQGQFSQMLQNI